MSNIVERALKESSVGPEHWSSAYVRPDSSAAGYGYVVLSWVVGRPGFQHSNNEVIDHGLWAEVEQRAEELDRFILASQRITQGKK